MCIAIVCFRGSDVRNVLSEIIFLIKPFFYITKELRQRFKYLENEKSFSGETKSIFRIFKELPVAKNCLGPESAPFR